jgi:integrase
MRGSLRQRSKGSWSLKVYFGRDPETGRGTYKYETVRGTKRDAEARLAQLIHAVETGSELVAKRLTVAEYLERWLESREKKVKRSTVEGYRLLIRAHIVPVIGSVPLSKLNPLHVEKVQAVVRGKGLSETSVLHVHRCLFAALRQAVKWQLVARNVAEAVEAPKAERHRVKAMEPEDARRVLTALAGTDLEMPTILALGTGMR